MLQSNSVSSGIVRTVGQECLARIENQALRAKLEQALATHKIFEVAEDCLNGFRSSAIRGQGLKAIFNSWRSTHFTAAVTADISQALSRSANHNLEAAAVYIQRISQEDRGEFGGDDHGELFDRMASWACQTSEWLDRSILSDSARQYSEWLRQAIAAAGNSSEVIASVLAFELFHRGECELAAKVFSDIATEEFDYSHEDARHLCEYPIAHGRNAADENKQNLLLAEMALQDFYSARGESINIDEVVSHVCGFYSRLTEVFIEAKSGLSQIH